MTTKELANFRTVLEARETELNVLLRAREVIAVNMSADMLDQIQNAQEPPSHSTRRFRNLRGL